MGKSLAEAAKDVLLTEGGVPSVSASDNNPDRDAKSSNENKASLKPGSKYKEPDPKHNEAEDLGGATPTKTPSENLGAKASGKKDTSKAAKASTEGETAPKKLSEEEAALEEVIAEMIESGMTEEEIEATLAEALEEESEEVVTEEDEEIEISEELESFISQKIEEGLSDEEIEEAISEAFEISEEESEVQETVIERSPVDMSEHVNALLEGEDLSEEFKSKATTIFESAVNAKLDEEVAILEETYSKSLQEETEKIYETLAEQVDDYLSYVTEQWLEANEVAIEPSLRTELTESFIAGLRNLFQEHYVEIPDDQVSVVEELGKKVEELTDRLNEEIESNVALNKQLQESTKNELVAEACDGLTDTQASKLSTLVENIEFTDQNEFVQKIRTIKESYFPSKPTTTSEPLDKAESSTDGKGVIQESLKGPMADYVKVLGKKLPN